MRCSLLALLSFVLLVSDSLALDIFVSSVAIANSSTLVTWVRTDADVPDALSFDLRFVQNTTDVGLALPNIQLGADDMSGHQNIVFPSNGSFVLVAVTGNTNIGRSNSVNILPPLTSLFPSATSSISTSSTAAPTGTHTPSSSPTPISAISQRRTNLAAVVGGILGALLFLALAVLVVIFIHRRRVAARKRLTFHRDMLVSGAMAQRRLSRAPSIPAIGAIAHPRPSETFAGDVERGISPISPSAAARAQVFSALGRGEPQNNDALRTAPAPVPTPTPPPLGTGHIVPPPKGPRPPGSAPLFTQRQLRPVLAPIVAPLPISATTGYFPRPGPGTAGAPLSAALGSAALAPSRTPSPPTPTTGADALALAMARTPTLAFSRGATPRQQEIHTRLAMLRRQMADLQLELENVSMSTVRTPVTAGTARTSASGPVGRAAEIRAALEDMARAVIWLREQEGGAWAMHESEVRPAGWARYMRP